MRHLLIRLFVLLSLAMSLAGARGEAMLQLFNVNYDELIRKMPEIAEAGYTSLWLPPPAKAGSAYSVGYDLFDPFDLGDKNQRGTGPTRYGSKAQLLQAIETAHRFGLRVYFDNITNHRGFETPGYNLSTPTNFYPGLRPQDFHLQTVSGGYFRNWPNIGNWSSTTEVQRQPLFGLVDLANEPGGLNLNFGNTLGATISKPSFIRHPGENQYYMDTNLPAIGGGLRPFNGTSGDPVPEDVNAYLVRSALWMVHETKCDGFRLDAIKHVPSGFFGDASDTPFGYAGAIQTMFDYVHGYGGNVTSNGYVETGGNRDSLFDTETARNDAMLFGEHLGEPPSYQEYLERGMRLLNSPYHYQLNNILGNPAASLSGLDQRDYRPSGGAFTGPQSVLFAQSHDDAFAVRRELQNAYYFTREGLPCIYSDGYNQATAGPGEEPFPRVASAPYLGQFGDNQMPDLAWLHQQLARGGTRSRWSDADVVAYERYDYRDVDLPTAFDNPDATVLIFAMNDNYESAISFDDGVPQTTDGTYYECFPVSASRGQGLAVGFPPGSVLQQLADSPGNGQACSRLLVRQATTSLSEAQSTANDPNPVNRKVYVGPQMILPGGGAIEFKIPAGNYVMYGYQWPEPSRANTFTNAIVLMQAGAPAPRVKVFRKDGIDGDPAFSPHYPFKMRGSVDPNGTVIAGANVSNLTYVIDVPVVTNAPFDIRVRSDASAEKVLVKLDGGVDLNSQMGQAPLTGLDRRDYRPGYSSDVYFGYELTVQQFRYGPEKFAAQVVMRNNVTSSGAEKWQYRVGGTNNVVYGLGNGTGITNSTAAWVYHDPSYPNTAASDPTATQRVPVNPAAGQAVEIHVKAGNKLQVNRCFIYFTTDGTSPEGAFGVGLGSTIVSEAAWVGADSENPDLDWWRGVIPAHHQVNGVDVRYKIALFNEEITPMTDADPAKLYGINQAAITNFNPANATVWLHNNLKTTDTITGLQTGFHIVRARTFLERPGKSAVYNTFLQTLYYAGPPPSGAIAFPPADGANLTGASYTVVVRADANVTAMDYTIQDGNGTSSGAASQTTPDTALSQQYPNYPQEFRFTYTPIPSSGTARITVRLKDLASAAYTNRYGTLGRTVNTMAPGSVLTITAPGANGTILTLATNQLYSIQACYSSSLGVAPTNFSILINGAFQPRESYIFRPSGCASGLRSIYYNWTGSIPGTNRIEVVYSNTFRLAETRMIAVARPGDSDADGMTDALELVAGTDPFNPNSLLRITNLDPNSESRLVVWESVPDFNYEVHATASLATPLTNISGTIPAAGTSTFFLDNSPTTLNKFYRIKVVP